MYRTTSIYLHELKPINAHSHPCVIELDYGSYGASAAVPHLAPVLHSVLVQRELCGEDLALCRDAQADVWQRLQASANRWKPATA